MAVSIQVQDQKQGVDLDIADACGQSLSVLLFKIDLELLDHLLKGGLVDIPVVVDVFLEGVDLLHEMLEGHEFSKRNMFTLELWAVLDSIEVGLVLGKGHANQDGSAEVLSSDTQISFVIFIIELAELVVPQGVLEAVS